MCYENCIVLNLTLFSNRHGLDYYRFDAEPIVGIEELPYPVKCGPELFNALASELADNSVEISSASAKRLYNAFQRGNDPNKNLKQLHLLESLKTKNDVAKPR